MEFAVDEAVLNTAFESVLSRKPITGVGVHEGSRAWKVKRLVVAKPGLSRQVIIEYFVTLGDVSRTGVGTAIDDLTRANLIRKEKIGNAATYYPID